MTRELAISRKLELPTDAVTSTIVIYGGKGTGKTNLASVLVEELAANDLRFAVIDPMGVWWGLRHGADGTSKGIKVLILGGIHGDLPITPESGALVADLVVDEETSAVIDISRRPDGSMWNISERIRFVRDYTKRLYQRQGEKRSPIHQVIDEAARFAPQIIRHGEGDVAACMGAIAVLVEEGRNVGIGVTLVTQRSARLNKDVAELADCMIAFRIVGPNSMSAVLDWLGEHVEKSRLKEIGAQLRSLPRGSALVVSPGWLEFEGVVAMRARKTFDSSKTPEAGADVRAPGQGAKVNLDKYKERLASLIEEQAANDPKALKARVAELEKQLAKGAKVPNKVTERVTERVVEKKVIPAATLTSIERLVGKHDKAIAGAATLADRTGAMMQKAAEVIAASSLRLEVELGKLRTAILDTKTPATAPARVGNGVNGHAPKAFARPPEARVVPSTPRPAASTDASLKPAHLRILSAIAWWEGVGVDTPDFTSVAFVAGTSAASSSFENNRARLRTAGYLDYAGSGRMRLTDTGRALTPAPDLAPTNAALQAQVIGMITPAHGRMLRAAIDAYPSELSYEDVADRAGASAASSSFENNRSWLRGRGLIEYTRAGHLRATALLFPEGA
jgi:hypothetical protein